MLVAQVFIYLFFFFFLFSPLQLLSKTIKLAQGFLGFQIKSLHNLDLLTFPPPLSSSPHVHSHFNFYHSAAIWGRKKKMRKQKNKGKTSVVRKRILVP